MDRRGFLKLFGVGLPAAVVAEKVGLIEQVRTYFFAPKMGWNQGPLGYIDGIPYFVNNSTTGEFYGLQREVVALQLENVEKYLPQLVESDAALYRLMQQDQTHQRTGTRTGVFKGIARATYPQIEWDKAIEI